MHYLLIELRPLLMLHLLLKLIQLRLDILLARPNLLQPLPLRRHNLHAQHFCFLLPQQMLLEEFGGTGVAVVDAGEQGQGCALGRAGEVDYFVFVGRGVIIICHQLLGLVEIAHSHLLHGRLRPAPQLEAVCHILKLALALLLTFLFLFRLF